MAAAGPASRAAPGSWSQHLRSDAVVDVFEHGRVLHAVHPAGVVDSTQDVALQLAAEGAESGTVVVADLQRRGRGRERRGWDDAPDGGSLAMTILIATPDRAAPLVPHAIGLAVTEAVTQVIGTPVALKWPNDVVHRRSDGAAEGSLSKLAGILVERELVGERDVLLIGIGLNVDHRSQEPVPGRTCLARIQERSVDARHLLVELLSALDRILDGLAQDPQAVLASYREHSDTLGRFVEVDLPGGERLSGRAEDIDEDGRLLVRTADRVVPVLAGTVRIVEGPR